MGTVRRNTTSRQKIPHLPSDHLNRPIPPTQCGETPPQGRKFPISLPTTQIAPSRQHSAAKHHLKAENSLSPFRPPKSPHPANTVRRNTTSRQKIPYLPSDHRNRPIPQTRCGETPPQGRKLPISLPTTEIAPSRQHSAAKHHLKAENSPSPSM